MTFKRGFLNSEKGRQALATESTSSSKSAVSSTPDNNSPSNPDRRSSEIDSSPAKELESFEVPLDLHAPPPWLDRLPGNDRYIFRQWPRAPDGKVIPKEHPEFGKRTSNGWYIWGETLYDFFQTPRMPTVPNFLTYSSGSRLAAWMRSFGELDAAIDELAWADAEGDPTEVHPCSVGQLICDYERNTAGLDPKHESSQIFLSRVPKLQARLPFYLLPERLIVHDPWNTLSVQDAHDCDDPSSFGNDDLVHTFELSMSEEGTKKQVAEREAADAADRSRVKQEEWRVMLPAVDDSGPLEPGQFAVHAKVPPRPPRPTSIPEAHLYISREDQCGTGNHSAVYFSELELPRWALVDDVLCEACFQVALQDEINERTEAGTFAPEDPQDQDKPAEINRTQMVVKDHRNVTLVTENVNRTSGQSGGSATTQYMRTTPRTVITEEYTGPVVRVYPKATWQNPERGPVCEHLRVRGLDPPLTARVKVCAKLSIQGDLHLAREAENYQAFPSHFFEHWNGYNLVYPLHDPTPCGALVPQFYGYYVPRGGFKPVVNDVVVIDPNPAAGSDAVTSDPKPTPQLPADYISPILLLEHCGLPIQIDELSEDDKSTCAALYLMFAEGGWTQNSMAERNVVIQPGPITDWPVFRGMSSRQRSFRLIDFGRAAPLRENYILLKDEILRLFKLHHHSR
ncbi:unnamed protein product [Peniophora sp. CBMAI 1063]|nr:unnamed protein product [Peniophora sp. CBMAI 1063]